MKKAIFALALFPSIVLAMVNPPWEEFYGPFDTWMNGKSMTRLSIPHGWLVYVRAKGGVTFVPDENHEWVLDAALVNSIKKSD